MASTGANSTASASMPPLPDYTLVEQQDLLSFVSDFWLSLALPVVAYWAVSMFFHVIDIWDLLPQYRLHTPDEITARNHVTRWECARDVVVQQVLQVCVGAILSLTEPTPMTGKENYDVSVWAMRLRLLQRGVPLLLGALGVNAVGLAKNVAGDHPLLAAALAGGQYPFVLDKAGDIMATVPAPAFAAWEMTLAKLIYWLVIPALQFMVAVFLLDTWQYFLHRVMHTNRWLYATFHSRHHRLYVPYAYGALYNHPFEGFLLDTLGSAVAFKISMMTGRQGMFFFTVSSVKTVDDHCGYSLPWDPIQLLSSNNAAYHDIHHQSWGIKSNFSQPYLTFWDRVLGTMWQGDTKVRYEREREAGRRRAEREAARKLELAAGAKAREATENGEPSGAAKARSNGRANGSAKVAVS